MKLDGETAVVGFINACMISLILERCGDDLTREACLKKRPTSRTRKFYGFGWLRHL